MKGILRPDLPSLFGMDFAVSAIVVLVSPSGKRRLIYDGTRPTAVDHGIRCRDKLRLPGPREEDLSLTRLGEDCEVSLSLVSDGRSAHRPVKTLPEEWGMLGRAFDSDPGAVYANKVGTFGICGAAKWWSRLVGPLLRPIYWRLGPDLPPELLARADDLEADLLGLHIGYSTYRMGLSRADWLAGWISHRLKKGSVDVRELHAAAGRMGFAAQVLAGEHLVLGPD